MTATWRLVAALACIALLAVSGAGPAFAEKRVALVIGNDSYANLAKLGKAVNDSEAVGDTLARLGFDVIRGRNLGRQGMIDKLAEFTSRVAEGDIAVFFYAGHGIAISGANYLVPTDTPAATSGAEARVRGASIAEADVIAEIQAKGPRVAMLVLDACRDNPFPRTGTRTVGNTRGLTDARPARGVFSLYSAGIGQTALDELSPKDRSRNSVFTTVFVEQLAKPGLHLGELAIEVRERVAALAQTARNSKNEPEPHEQTPAYYDQTIGGRVYIGGDAPRPEQPARQARPARLALALVAQDPTKAVGPALRDYGDPNRTYGIERDLTLRGDIESFTPVMTAQGSPAIMLTITKSAVERINRVDHHHLVGLQIALVLDGRTVLSAPVVREPLGTQLQLSGGFTFDDIKRLASAIEAGR